MSVHPADAVALCRHRPDSSTIEFPATVVMIPAGSIRRIRSFLNLRSTDSIGVNSKAVGLFSCAA